MKKTTILFLVFALTGCASVGNKSIAHVSQQNAAIKIIKGTTTEAQVRAMYGDPTDTSFTDSGNSIWKYVFSKSHATAASYIPIVNIFDSGTSGTEKELVIFFDKNGIVQNYSVNDSPIKSHVGIF